MTKLGYAQNPSHKIRVRHMREGIEFPQLRGIPHSPVAKLKCRLRALGNKSRTGQINSLEVRKNQSKAMLGNQRALGYKQTAEHINKRIRKTIGFTGLRHNQETKVLMSASAEINWSIPEYKEMLVHSMLESVQSSPNMVELKLLGIIEEYGLPFHYNRDMQVGGKIPDFISNNGENLIIELFGDYWHQGEIEQDLINHYSKYNYKTLILWEKELNTLLESTIALLILDLIHRGGQHELD